MEPNGIKWNQPDEQSLQPVVRFQLTTIVFHSIFRFDFFFFFFDFPLDSKSKFNVSKKATGFFKIEF